MKTKGRRMSGNVQDKTGAPKRPLQTFAQAAHRSKIGQPPSLSKPTGAFSKVLANMDERDKKIRDKKIKERNIKVFKQYKKLAKKK